MAEEWRNKLFFGDNLEILREHVASESVDLVYLDPPFNSKADYNVLFKTTAGEASAAQATAFRDTWEWDTTAAQAFHELMMRPEVPGTLKDLMEALKVFLTGDTGSRGNSMMAYLTMMALRLVELHRVLKPTGSLYLHCDPTASHYMKLVLDAIFGFKSFRNEIIWKRTSGHSDARRYGDVHDTILFYSRTEEYTWNQLYQPYETGYVEQYYRYQDENGERFMSGDLGAAGLLGGGYTYEWKGVTRLWRLPVESMARLEQEGRLFYTRNGIPRIKRYLRESKGLPCQSVWSDLEALRSWHQERIGYPTQKPEALLERIIQASSNEGDLVLDPFCGCGTTIAVAEKLNRRWIGIDVTYLAVDLMERRLLDMFSPGGITKRLADIPVQKRRHALKAYWAKGEDELGIGIRTGLRPFEVLGVPQSEEDARFLFQNDPYQFEWWAVAMLGAQGKEYKRGADKGIDGIINFQDKEGQYKKVLVSVKGGHVRREMIATLKGDMAREGAVTGVLVTLEEPTGPMKHEAADAGRWNSELNPQASFPVIQILTAKEILEGHMPDIPRWGMDTFKRAPKVEKKSEHPTLDLGDD